MSTETAYRCGACGETWNSDPRELVPCPDCGARVGARCVHPSGHRVFSGFEPHVSRERAALSAGVLRMCPAGESSRDAQLALGGV